MLLALQVAATPKDPRAELRPSSDVSDAKWFPVDMLEKLESECVQRHGLHGSASALQFVSSWSPWEHLLH